MTAILLPCPGSEDLAKKMAAQLGLRLGGVEYRRFPDLESYVRVRSEISGKRVILVGALDRPDAKMLPLIFLANTARDLGAREVGLVCPYLPYMRQDKRFKAGEGVTSQYFASMLGTAVDWFVTVDPHLHRHGALSELYSIPTSVVHAAPRIASWIRENVRMPLVIGPDSESVQWVSAVAREAGAPFAVLNKRRFGDRRVEVSDLPEAKVHARTPVLVDDIVSTARTMIETVKRLRAHGARRPYCIAVHGIFADDAYRDLRRAGARRIVSSNTVAHASNAIDMTDLLAEQVRQRLKGRRVERR